MAKAFSPNLEVKLDQRSVLLSEGLENRILAACLGYYWVHSV